MGWADQFALRWAVWRNGLIAKPALRAMASWFPPARWAAQYYARSLFDLTAGFVYSQTLLAFVESGLLGRMSRGPIEVGAAGETAGLDRSAVETLLKAAAALGLAQEIGGLWALGRNGAALAASPGVSEMIRHHRLLYADLADPLAMLRREDAGRLAALWRYDGSARPDDVEAYSALMAASQPMVAEQALAAYDFGRHRRLLDVGGGSGAFLEQVVRRHPHLDIGLVDRAAVIEQARSRLGDSCAYHPGSFLTDPLPSGYDLISLVRVLHDHDDEPASRLLAAVRSALPPGGRVMIVEPFADTPGAEPMGGAYFGMYLAAMRSGRPRSASEYNEMLHEAGFSRAWRVRTAVPLIASIIVGQN